MRSACAIIAVTAIGLGLLAACSPPSGSSSSAASAAAANVETPVVDLKGLPHIAAGYWEATEKDGAKPATTSRFCLPDSPLWTREVDNTGCTVQVFTRTGRGDIIDTATCKQNGFTLVDRLDYQGDLARAFVVDITTTNTGPTISPERTTSRTAYRLIGPCPPGGK